MSRVGAAVEASYSFENRDLFRSLCGVADSEIAHLEELLDVELIPRGHTFLIRSPSRDKIAFVVRFFEIVSRRYGGGALMAIDRFDLSYMARRMRENEADAAADATGERIEEHVAAALDEEPIERMLREKILTTVRGRDLMPRTINQARFVRSALENPVTLSVGPAGTGKTFLAVAVAARLMQRGEVQRIILTRPAVEAGESLGFLPGDLAQKVDPYLRPLYDALYECLGMEKVHEHLSAGKIEIAPLAFMRGRTLNDSFVILDEAQNCTLAQLKMFLTRLGRNSRMSLGGDATQIDLAPDRSGFTRTIALLESIQGCGVIRFGRDDIVRHPLVERIVAAFEQAEAAGG